MKYFLTILCISIIMHIPLPVWAMGVGVTPSVLDFTTNINTTSSNFIILTNPSNEPGLFTLSADDFTDWFIISPAEVRLESNETKKIKVIIAPNKSGRFVTNLSVIGYPLDTRSFKAGSGVKLPITFVVLSTSRPWRQNIGLILIGLAMSGGIMWWQYQRRRNLLWKIKKIFHF